MWSHVAQAFLRLTVRQKITLTVLIIPPLFLVLGLQMCAVARIQGLVSARQVLYQVITTLASWDYYLPPLYVLDSNNLPEVYLAEHFL